LVVWLEKNREEINLEFARKGFVLSSQSLSRMLEEGLDPADVLSAAEREKSYLITNDFLERFIADEEEIEDIAEDLVGDKKPEVVVEKTKQVYAKEIESELTIHEVSDVTDKSTCSGTLEDFVGYFNTRYRDIKQILRERPNLRAPIPVNEVKKASEVTRDDLNVVGIVSGKRESSRYKFLDIEDPSGEITVLVPKDSDRLNAAYDSILLDEVIGVVGRASNNIFVANEFCEPELPLVNTPNYAEEPAHTVFLSDLHIGSYLFLEKEFDNFLTWLTGKGNRREVSEKVKYILIAGDSVDGIGIYPHQEKELVIPDIQKQYEFLALLLERIPDHIEVVLSMGNHDGVRNAEPQPRLSKDIGGPLFDLPNVHVVGNPVRVTTHGVNTLMYHGTTLDTIIGNLASCTYSAPENAMIQYLKKRHLAPVYGGDGIAPEDRDYLAINDIPDILHCGHVHTNGYTTYRGVSVINSGTWQGKTKYQEELGHVPTPARAPVVNLMNNEVTVLHFGG